MWLEVQICLELCTHTVGDWVRMIVVKVMGEEFS